MVSTGFYLYMLGVFVLGIGLATVAMRSNSKSPKYANQKNEQNKKQETVEDTSIQETFDAQDIAQENKQQEQKGIKTQLNPPSRKMVHYHPIEESNHSTTHENKPTEDTYEEVMFLAFIQSPDKLSFYKQALEKVMVTGEPTFHWIWSWWAFFGGGSFFLYRKLYFPAVAYFFFIWIPLVPFILSIIAGGVGPYLVIRRYHKLKQQIEAHIHEEQLRIQSMKQVGGVHNWVIWVNVIFYVLMFIIIFVTNVYL